MKKKIALNGFLRLVWVRNVALTAPLHARCCSDVAAMLQRRCRDQILTVNQPFSVCFLHFSIFPRGYNTWRNGWQAQMRQLEDLCGESRNQVVGHVVQIWPGIGGLIHIVYYG